MVELIHVVACVSRILTTPIVVHWCNFPFVAYVKNKVVLYRIGRIVKVLKFTD